MHGSGRGNGAPAADVGHALGEVEEEDHVAELRRGAAVSPLVLHHREHSTNAVLNEVL